MTFAHLGQASDAGVYIGLERGYFAEEGIDLESLFMDSGGRMVPSLAAGQLDAGGGAISVALINAVSRDVPIKLIADKGSQRPGFGFKALSVRQELLDSGAVRTVADLRGRKVAVNTATSIDIYHLQAALQTGGLDVGDVTLEEITYRTRPPRWRTARSTPRSPSSPSPPPWTGNGSRRGCSAWKRPRRSPRTPRSSTRRTSCGTSQRPPGVSSSPTCAGSATTTARSPRARAATR